MTHTYAIRRLLEHGPLTFAELVDITGWERDNLTDVLRHMAKRGTIRRTFAKGCHRFIYRLPHDLSHLQTVEPAADAGTDRQADAGRVFVRPALGVPAYAGNLRQVRPSNDGRAAGKARMAGAQQ